MKHIAIAIAGVLALLASTTAHADPYEWEEEEEDWGSESISLSDPYCYASDYDSYSGEDPNGGAWGWGWVEWIEIRDPGSCTAYDCAGRCDLWTYPCETGTCGDVMWGSCTMIGCDEFSNCA